MSDQSSRSPDEGELRMKIKSTGWNTSQMMGIVVVVTVVVEVVGIVVVVAEVVEVELF